MLKIFLTFCFFLLPLNSFADTVGQPNWWTKNANGINYANNVGVGTLLPQFNFDLSGSQRLGDGGPTTGQGAHGHIISVPVNSNLNNYIAGGGGVPAANLYDTLQLLPGYYYLNAEVLINKQMTIDCGNNDDNTHIVLNNNGMNGFHITSDGVVIHNCDFYTSSTNSIGVYVDAPASAPFYNVNLEGTHCNGSFGSCVTYSNAIGWIYGHPGIVVEDANTSNGSANIYGINVQNGNTFGSYNGGVTIEDPYVDVTNSTTTGKVIGINAADNGSPTQNMTVNIYQGAHVQASNTSGTGYGVNVTSASTNTTMDLYGGDYAGNTADVNGTAPGYVVFFSPITLVHGTQSGNFYPNTGTVSNIDGLSVNHLTALSGGLDIEGGNIGIGTVNVTTKMSILGGQVIGSTAAYTSATIPSGNLIIQGNMGIGSLNPGTQEDIQGTLRILNGNIGIGTSQVPYALIVQGPDGANASGLFVNTQASTSGPTIEGYTTNGTTKNIFVQGNLAMNDAQQQVFGTASNFLESYNPESDSTYTIQNNQGYSFVTVDNPASTFSDVCFNGGGSYSPTMTSCSEWISAGGNVGIGSINPGQLMDVKGTMRILGTNGSLSIGTANVPPTNGLMVLGNVSIGTGTTSSNALTVYNPSNSNVSIGSTSSASQFLSVIGNVGIGTAGASSMQFTSPVPVGGLMVQGNVGIGTSTVGTGSLISIGGRCKGSAVFGDDLTICQVGGAGGVSCIGYCTAGTFPTCTTCTCC